MFDITKRTTITTDWAQLKTVQEQMNLAEIMLEVGLGLLFDLLAMLVRAGEEHHVLAAQTVVARDRIGRDGGIGVADVELCRRIIDRRCDIKCILFCHLISFFPASAEWKRRNIHGVYLKTVNAPGQRTFSRCRSHRQFSDAL